MKKELTLTTIALILVVAANPAAGQLGYKLEQSVIAGGGSTSVSPTWAVGGTIGQAAAGLEMVGLPFGVTSGYWATTSDVSASGTLNISGRVRTANGRGITNATIRITGGLLASPIVEKTTRNGVYSVPGLTAGQQYVVTVNSRRFVFTPNSQTVTIQNDLTNLDFTAVN
ncbi:MAG: carboxypeptidase-like regulatory domain-containing protein [Pyrinomonadaceae bacterium]